MYSVPTRQNWARSGDPGGSLRPEYPRDSAAFVISSSILAIIIADYDHTHIAHYIPVANHS